MNNIFNTEEQINVVFLGGSITEGAGASSQSNCFANSRHIVLTAKLLKEKPFILHFAFTKTFAQANISHCKYIACRKAN